MNFGDRLKSLREERDLTQTDLGNLVSLSKANISKYETGKLSPNIETVNYLASYFKVTTDYLLGRSDHRDLIANAYPMDLNTMVKIPVIGRIRAGEPILAVESITNYEFVQEDTVKNGEYFYLQVTGDSMVNANILPGSLVLVRRQSDVDDGQIAVILIDGEDATLKRIFRQNGHLILQSENPKYPPRIIKNGEVRIVGKIVEVKFKLE